MSINDLYAGKFIYKPSIGYNLVSAEDSAKASEFLKDFKKGYLYPLEHHILNADGLGGYLGSVAVTPEIFADFRLRKKEIDDAITAIVRGYSILEMELQPKQLDTLARREYFNLFSDIDMEQAKIDFIKMLKTYEHLKKFNSEIRENWTFLKKTFEHIKPSSLNTLFLEQVLIFKIYPRLELCDQTDLLLRRLAYILKIKNEEQVVDRFKAEGEYTSLITYHLSTIFQTDLDTIITDARVVSKVEVKKENWIDTPESCIKGPYLLDSRGQESFNQSYVYALNMSKDRLAIEESKIKRAMYIEMHLGTKDLALRSDLIREFISQAKSKHRLDEYNNFLHEYFDFTKDALLLHFFDFSEAEKNIMCYHFGPVYFLKIVVHFMMEGRTGFIHRHLQKDQMVRELPFEYLKFILKDWWDLNIFQRVSKTDRNSQDKYSHIISAINKMWRQDQPKVLAVIKKDTILLRAFKVHDLKPLEPVIANEISYLFYTIFVRFLGIDFLYLSNNKTLTINT